MLFILLAALATSCSPARPKGPQPTGVNSRAFVGDAELEIQYRFESQVGKEIVLYVDAIGHRGAPGDVRLSLRLDGFTVVRGEPEWKVSVAPSRTETHQLILRAVERKANVTVITHHIERDVELATDELRFWVDDEGYVGECGPEVEACK